MMNFLAGIEVTYCPTITFIMYNFTYENEGNSSGNDDETVDVSTSHDGKSKTAKSSKSKISQWSFLSHTFENWPNVRFAFLSVLVCTSPGQHAKFLA